MAVKTQRSDASAEEQSKFLLEAQLMAALRHEHIVGLIGAVTRGSPVMLVLELMDRTLLEHVRGLEGGEMGDCGQLVGLLSQVCSAMVFLAGRGVVHRDLAAR